MDPRLAAAWILGAGASLAAHAELFKCVQPDGKVVYQDAKCPEDARQSTVRPPDERMAAPVAKDAAPGAKADAAAPAAITMESVIEVLANYQGCAEQFPAFASKYGAAFQQWKQKNLAAITRYEQDGAARMKVRQSLEYTRRQAASDTVQARDEKAEICENALGPVIDGKAAQR